MTPDTRERYGTLSRLLHWTMAVLVIWQALKLFDRVNNGEHWVGQVLVPWHISIGTLIGVLIVVRIIWALRNLDNRPPPAPSPTLGMLARAGHIALYAGMVLLPLSGISIMVGNGYGLEAFGLQIVPAGAEIPWLATFGGVLHSPVAWLTVLLAIGHIVMALWHGLVRKDGVLQRML
ncbi:MAG: cytochrome b [Gammaproteobacteria bacterium]|nr:cytochrome b [Gammaproteobacteria bacterium]